MKFSCLISKGPYTLRIIQFIGVSTRATTAAHQTVCVFVIYAMRVQCDGFWNVKRVVWRLVVVATGVGGPTTIFCENVTYLRGVGTLPIRPTRRNKKRKKNSNTIRTLNRVFKRVLKSYKTELINGLLFLLHRRLSYF